MKINLAIAITFLVFASLSKPAFADANCNPENNQMTQIQAVTDWQIESARKQKQEALLKPFQNDKTVGDAFTSLGFKSAEQAENTFLILERLSATITPYYENPNYRNSPELQFKLNIPTYLSGFISDASTFAFVKAYPRLVHEIEDFAKKNPQLKKESLNGLSNLIGVHRAVLDSNQALSELDDHERRAWAERYPLELPRGLNKAQVEGFREQIVIGRRAYERIESMPLPKQELNEKLINFNEAMSKARTLKETRKVYASITLRDQTKAESILDLLERADLIGTESEIGREMRVVAFLELYDRIVPQIASIAITKSNQTLRALKTLSVLQTRLARADKRSFSKAQQNKIFAQYDLGEFAIGHIYHETGKGLEFITERSLQNFPNRASSKISVENLILKASEGENFAIALLGAQSKILTPEERKATIEFLRPLMDPLATPNYARRLFVIGALNRIDPEMTQPSGVYEKRRSELKEEWYRLVRDRIGGIKYSRCSLEEYLFDPKGISDRKIYYDHFFEKLDFAFDSEDEIKTYRYVLKQLLDLREPTR